MDWTNETIIEFIQLLQTEPSIWNHRAKSHKNRALMSEAWNRIQINFSLDCTIEELKRKRNSLLTQYRDILRRIKESQLKACEGQEIYKPSWFAYDVMNSYLRPLYDDNVTVKPEELMVSYDEDPLSNESDTYLEIEQPGEIDPGVNSNKKLISWEANSRTNSHRRLSHESTTLSEHDSYIPKKRRANQKLRVPQVDDTNGRHHEECDRVRECDLYGQLLAEKLKPLEQDERLRLMNEIDNLVFNHLMTIRKRKTCENNKSVKQSIHLPGPSNKIP